jgi:hypothetical protein
MQQSVPSDLGSAETVLRQVRRLSHLYQLRLADIQSCPGGYLLDLQQVSPLRLEEQSNRPRRHLIVDVELDDEGTHMLVPQLGGYRQFLKAPPQVIALCSQFSRRETTVFLRQHVIGPALANGLAMDQLDVHLWETARQLHLEETAPNGLRLQTYCWFSYGYLLRPGPEVSDYLDVALPFGEEEIATTPLDDDYVASLACGTGGAIAAVYCWKEDAERAARELKRWRKQNHRKANAL